MKYQLQALGWILGSIFCSIVGCFVLLWLGMAYGNWMIDLMHWRCYDIDCYPSLNEFRAGSVAITSIIIILIITGFTLSLAKELKEYDRQKQIQEHGLEADLNLVGQAKKSGKIVNLPNADVRFKPSK